MQALGVLNAHCFVLLLQVVTESVRLTDENHLLEQTDENGDVFLWLKHQAQQGVVSAQVGGA